MKSISFFPLLISLLFRTVCAGETVHPLAQARFDRGPLDSAMTFGYVTLMLQPTDAQQAALDRLLQEQQDRSSPNYHRWLTPEQFGERFGATAGDYAGLASWLESQGLHIEGRARARNWVAFSGSLAAVQGAFRTEIHRYVVNGVEHFANATELKFPAAFAGMIAGVRGLNDFWKTEDVRPQYTSPNGATQLSPADWAAIYDVAPLYSMGIDGSGQRIVIVGRSDFNQSYFDSFRRTFGLPPSTVEQHLIGPDPGITNAANEGALDTEWSGAIAPKATIVYVYAGNFNDAAQGAVDQNLGTVMSESFGNCEPNTSSGLRSIAQQANAQGITWLASSGDSGGASCDPHGFFGTTGNDSLATGGLAVNNPAGFPEVTAVGGTQFNEGGGQYWPGGTATSYIPEVVWNETGSGGLLASGGGASIYYPKPAWQVGPGVPDDNARDLPDISFSAAGNHDPYAVFNSNGQRATGGTSASSPSFAGVLALLNQYVVASGIQQQPGLGNINPQLYRMAQTTTNVFHDITEGNNMVPCAQGSKDCTTGMLGFSAGPGYDQATGLGSLDVYNFVTQWSGSAASTTSVAASSDSIAFGDSVQLTATVTGSGGVVPTGSVTFTAGHTSLGTAALQNVDGAAMATLTASGPVLPAGTAVITATYNGDATFNGSSGSVSVAVAAPTSRGSFVTLSISPNPAKAGQSVKVTLTEEAGVPTTVTGWTINGRDDTSLLAQDFGGTSLPAFGTLFSVIQTVGSAPFPATRAYAFTGQDADGRQWTATGTLTLVGTASPQLLLSSVPDVVQQNPATDASCQWWQQLLLQDQDGLAVQLTRLLVGGADWTSQITSLFGTNRMAPWGSLQATVCWPTGDAPQAVALDGVDQNGDPVRATLGATSQFTGPASNPATMSVAPATVTMTPDSTGKASASIALSFSDGGPVTWTASVFPANQTTSWLTLATDSAQLILTAARTTLAAGVYNATVVIQAVNTIPQVIEAPVVFVVGTASGARISGVSNAFSYQPAFAPGMMLDVAGSQLAPTQTGLQASGVPLPLRMLGVSATVNGVPAPLYYVSDSQVNVQIPYETGAGPAVLGINNNGNVASYVFNVAASGPGIFADANGAILPLSTGQAGDTVALYVTGDGAVSPLLDTGASPFSATPLALLPKTILPVGVTVGGVAAQTTVVGVTPGLAGVTQVNFIVPD